MTYCVALNLKDGLILVSDSRTNAGVDQISVYKKLFSYQVEGERAIFIQCSGNLATSQAVIELVNFDIKRGMDRSILKVATLFNVAEIISEKLVQVIRKMESSASQNINFKSNFMVSGQIKGEGMKLYYIYPEGNFISSTKETPYFQIGETKYGKPILDRTIHYALQLDKALISALVSFDSAIKSNISVGFPINLLVYEKNSYCSPKGIIVQENDGYFSKVREEWNQGIVKLLYEIELPPNRYYK